jgi:hypothetical protein
MGGCAKATDETRKAAAILRTEYELKYSAYFNREFGQ